MLIKRWWQIEYTDVYAHEVSLLPTRYYFKWHATLVAYLKQTKLKRSQHESIRDYVQIVEIKRPHSTH